jgi:hypothetical protein
MSPFQATIISAITALVTSLVVAYFAQYLKARAEAIQEAKLINRKYLNPLRLYLEETHFRLNEIFKKVKDEKGNGKCDILLYVQSPEEISKKRAVWFNGEGCYLVSSCYLTGCLFYQIRKVLDDLSYLRLKKEDDTVLSNLIFNVRHAFLQDIGIFYATQPSIGIDMYLPKQNRLLSYREFCQLLQDPEKRVWFDRLINYYLETGQGHNLARVGQGLQAIEKLSVFLDEAVGGGSSIEKRYQSEGKTK